MTRRIGFAFSRRLVPAGLEPAIRPGPLRALLRLDRRCGAASEPQFSADFGFVLSSSGEAPL